VSNVCVYESCLFGFELFKKPLGKYALAIATSAAAKTFSSEKARNKAFSIDDKVYLVSN
jgi:hypothetical protein